MYVCLYTYLHVYIPMLPMVIYITNGIITDWGTPLLSHLWGSIALAKVALHII